MTIPNTINDTHTAGREWLRRKLEQEEWTLNDYSRPTKTVIRKKVSPFQSQVCRYGFISACFKEIAP